MQGRTDLSKAQLERARLRAVPLFKAGLDHWEIAECLGFERSTISRWHGMWVKGGVEALKPKPDKGSKPRLTPAQCEAVTRATAGKVLRLSQIGAWIADTYGARLGKTRIWQLAHKHGWGERRK